MNKKISHRDGWIVVQSGEPVTGLISTRLAARLFASTRNRVFAVNRSLHASKRCVVYPGRQITVWMPEKLKGAKR